jgi:signal transduction histidine kinase
VLDLRLKLHLALVQSQRQLEQKNMRLLEAARKREEIDRIIQHDLRTPLNAILSDSSTLLRQETLPDDVFALIRRINAASHDIHKFITVTAQSLKIGNQNVILEKSRVDLLEILEQVLADLAGLAAAARVSIVMRMERPQAGGIGAGGIGKEYLLLSPGTRSVSLFAALERSLCRFMFSNLIKNALEASPPQAQVTLTLAPTEERIHITLHNQGAIPADIRSRFFEKDTTYGKTGGTGLGAYSARLIARSHGGDITFTSAENIGTMLALDLPRK